MNKLLKTIREDFNDSIRKTKQFWIGWLLKRLKKKADKLRETEQSQMFVVKLDGKIRIISKRWFKHQRQKGIFPKSFTTDKLKKVSFYYTAPCKND